MYNNHFKPPSAYPPRPRRSPSPPNSFIEPLSPAKPTPIEPNFNYPAINNNVDFTVHAQTAQTTLSKAEDHGARRRRGHVKTPSTIDALADAALALSPSFNSLERGSSLAEQQVNGYGFARRSHHAQPTGEPPHKRARSEAQPSDFARSHGARPATSYETIRWANAGHHLPAPYSHERRVEEAALLLNFSTTGGSPLATLTPLAPAAGLSATPRPHANSFPRDPQQQRPDESILKASLLPPFDPQNYILPPPVLPSPQRTSEGNGTSPEASSERNAEDPLITDSLVQSSSNTLANAVPPQQTRTPPEEPESHAVNGKRIKDTVTAPKKRGWPKGKPRGPSVKKTTVDKPPSKRTSGRKKLNDSAKAKAALSTFSSVEKAKRQRRHSSSAVPVPAEKVKLELARRSQSVPRDVHLVIREMSQLKTGRRTNRTTAVTICAKCNRTRNSTASAGELDEWISCNGCKQWFHLDCAGFKKSHEVRDVDKYFCAPCEPTHGTTTYVRKSSRAHTSVDYAELQRGVLKTSEESNEHHYVAPIKNGTFRFDPETFPRMRPELVTRDFFERSGAFVEPICIPAEWNPRPWEMKRQLTAATGDLARDSEKDDMRAHDFEYDTVPDDGQDKLDMVMPQGLTVRNVCDLVGPDTPLDVIDVKTQNSGSKWTLSKWADYYEEDGDEKPVRNVISLEVSHTKLGRLLRRPKVVRDIDLQDAVWPREETDKGKFPKVQFYCLMSIADSYTDFHIDFGGSSVYYHVLKGKKTFLFIPPKAKHLKAYEEWNDSPQQNFTFLPDITKECYRVDLSEGDTMLIPSGWIHAVWTPETSLVIGGNFLTRMSFKNQFKVVEIEKNNETPQKFRYPHFQRIMWYTAINYLKADPLPPAVSQMFYEGQQFERVRPIWEDFDGDVAEADPRPGAKNARYYSQAEMEGLPEVANFIFRTVMLVMGRIEGISADRMRRVNASIPKGYGEPLEVAKTFALWVAWKRGNEDPPAWAHPDAMLPNSKEEGAPKKLSARAIKDLERKEAFAAFKVAPDRQSNRVQSRQAQLAAAVPAGAPAPALGNSDNATTHPDTPWIFSDRGHATASTAIPSAPSTPMHLPAQLHQEDSFASSNADAPPAAPSVIMMIGAFPGQYLSTPKSSVLGPKRVACDACRKRRIRCKHKDAVVEVVPGVTPPSHAQNGFQSSGAPDLDDDMTVASARENGQLGAYITDETNDRLENGTFSTQNGLSVHGGPGHLPTDGPRPMPGTNAYIDANIPMAMNGVSLFGDISKRSRSKACFECRKSKVTRSARHCSQACVLIARSAPMHSRRQRERRSGQGRRESNTARLDDGKKVSS